MLPLWSLAFGHRAWSYINVYSYHHRQSEWKISIEGSNCLRRFHDHCNTTRLDSFLHSNGDLFRQAFLDLKTPAERLRNARQLGQPENELIWDIRYSNLLSSFSRSH